MKITVTGDNLVAQPDAIEKAMVRTLKEVSRSAAKIINQKTREEWNIPAGVVRGQMKAVVHGDSVAFLNYWGTRIPLVNFGARSRMVSTASGPRRGVSVLVKKSNGRKLSRRGFLAKNQIYTRVGRERMPIKMRTGPSLAQMVDDEEIQAAVAQHVEERLPVVLERNVDFYLGLT